MVHAEVQPLLALALEILEKAKGAFVRRLALHCAALALLITGAIVAESNHQVELAAASLAVLIELAALFMHIRAMHLHSSGRQAMRRVLLLDALQPMEATTVLRDWQHHLSGDVRRKAEAAQARDKGLATQDKRLANYYLSDSPPGQARLRDHLFESAIFSHHLYDAAWKFSLVWLGILGTATIVIVAALLFWVPVHEGGHVTNQIARVVIALVAFIPAGQELDHLVLYRAAERQLREILPRLRSLYADPLQGEQPNFRLMSEFGDYSAATVFAPPIRTRVYNQNVERLLKETKAEMAALSGRRGNQ